MNLSYRQLLYKSLLQPIWSYGIALWGTAKPSLSDNPSFPIDMSSHGHQSTLKHGSLLTSMTLNLGSMAIKSSGLTEIILTVTTHEEVVFSLQSSLILKHLLSVQTSTRSSAVYLPPNSTLPDFEAHTSSIEHLISTTNPTSILLCGDYNLPLIKWSKSNQGLFASGTMSNTSTHLVDSFSYYNFYQLNQVPNARGCLLDLVFSSFDTPTVQLANTPIVSPVMDVSTTDIQTGVHNTPDSYHPPLFISFPFPTPITAQVKHKYRDYKSADKKSMLRYLGSFDWESTFSLYSVDDSAVVFNDALLSSINQAKCKRQSKVDYSAHFGHTEETLSSSPSKFCKFVNNLKQKPPIPSSLHLGNIASNTPTESANLFSTHFSSTFNSSSFQLPPFTGSSDYLSYELPSDITFTVDDVFSALKSLKNTYSNGPDDISAQCLYNCRFSIAYPIYLIFRRSLDLGIFPKVWKISSITPVLKSGDASDIQSYRPISIIPHIEVIEHRSQVDVIFTDFNKAFDTVDHDCLIMVLKSLGIGNPLLSWLHSYITDRKQFIKIKNAVSKSAVIPSGVPQGGHLSPLLFILFVNSITKWITKAKLLIFADDIKIFLKIDNLNQCHILQSELDIFASWAHSIGLSLNISKCHVMSFSRQQSPIHHNYSLNGTSLNCVFLYKDLGIHYSPSLNFEHHINVTVGKALKVLGFIKRNTNQFSSARCLCTLYFSLVRSILEYGVVVWHPYLAKDELRLERVQNRFLSYIAYIMKIPHPTHDYSLIRSSLGIPMLSTRRQDADERFITSLLGGTIDAPDLLSKICFRIPSFSRNHALFQVPTHNTLYGHKSPLTQNAS
ncbi:uncharacterized protein LOC132926003 [Rhopalosiphum padi]|uniref:uncharacterized protein LOC132926003 n=1 Tax=Rhopalosiphum padi TaxID=40932 RepID=UPI00298DA187|nr:uncharacterized protein LOC132926003 [Rhopalosiphum padi]